MKRRQFIKYLSILSMVSLSSFAADKKSKKKSKHRQFNSPNFKNGAFQNQIPTPQLTIEKNPFFAMMAFVFSKKERATPISLIPSVQTDLLQLNPSEDVMIWFGHSSYFFQIDGKRILVDPVFSGYGAPVSFMNKAFKGTSTYTAAMMPNIDLLLLTHDHYDHLDYDTMKKLRPRIGKIICGLGVGAHLEDWGFDATNIQELDWEETTQFGDWKLTATPARHFSGRGIQRNNTLWLSFVLATNKYKIFIGGDSGYGPHFANIGAAHGPFDLALLEQGQYNKRWCHIHMMPTEVMRAVKDLKVKRLFAGHNSKFKLSDHPWDEPMKKLAENCKQEGIQNLTPKIGELVYLDRTKQEFSEWWRGLN